MYINIFGGGAMDISKTTNLINHYGVLACAICKPSAGARMKGAERPEILVFQKATWEVDFNTLFVAEQ